MMNKNILFYRKQKFVFIAVCMGQNMSKIIACINKIEYNYINVLFGRKG